MPSLATSSRVAYHAAMSCKQVLIFALDVSSAALLPQLVGITTHGLHTNPNRRSSAAWTPWSATPRPLCAITSPHQSRSMTWTPRLADFSDPLMRSRNLTQGPTQPKTPRHPHPRLAFDQQ